MKVKDVIIMNVRTCFNPTVWRQRRQRMWDHCPARESCNLIAIVTKEDERPEQDRGFARTTRALSHAQAPTRPPSNLLHGEDFRLRRIALPVPGSRSALSGANSFGLRATLTMEMVVTSPSHRLRPRAVN